MWAQDKPVCGRAAGRFSTLTVRAGRTGTLPERGARPLNGHTGGGADGELPLPPGEFPAAAGPWERPPRNTTATARAATTATMLTTPIATRPRLVAVMGGASLIRGDMERARCYRNTRSLQRPMTRSSLLLQQPDPLLDG